MTERIFVEASNLINGERREAYGDATSEYDQVAQMWTGLLLPKLRQPITAKETLLMMTVLKLRREAHQHKPDNLVDAAGYLALADRCVPRKGVEL